MSGRVHELNLHAADIHFVAIVGLDHVRRRQPLDELRFRFVHDDFGFTLLEQLRRAVLSPCRQIHRRRDRDGCGSREHA